MAGRQRTSFDKMQRERARQEEQARKRARRRGVSVDGTPLERDTTPTDEENTGVPAEPGPASDEPRS
jgi:hypothetical protein